MTEILTAIQFNRATGVDNITILGPTYDDVDGQHLASALIAQYETNKSPTETISTTQDLHCYVGDQYEIVHGTIDQHGNITLFVVHTIG
jgi:phosphoheptose isomerase